ncbi:RagB/SusD family nutrient uptake outer membrane protein [Bacteroides sp. 51]|uniref:RagB/SusD family nutrient uptake outer membrane protein n=1 Tax=Bacteroides sp. 51 TaxID=2302938 RepID=UPI0013D73050|nr:RagB/SusD family nutrient uptake outer membrane protein [Bacteroides sp. 51]NDV80380.1 RagB/SusD family nutrient uptake outer membrane protein [Bacteroides sp. 51]
MKRYIKTIGICLCGSLFCLSAALWTSCNDDFLNEVPKAELGDDNVLTSVKGFEHYIISLHQFAKEELSGDDLRRFFNMFTGTDIITVGQLGEPIYRNYETFLTPDNDTSSRTWNWLYTSLIPYANNIIQNAEREDLKHIWKSEEERNAIIAEAKFFRGYAYNILANLYGGVPIVDKFITTPKTDFVRASRQDVYEFIAGDLEFASTWLPTTVSKDKEGRIVKGAADHLLSEVYISLGQYDKAIKSATDVIDCGLYKLMTERFGSEKSQPGDVFSDLFKQGNMNRSSGNLETIYVWQYEEYTPGGAGTMNGNHMVRGALPFLVQLTDPNGKLGMSLHVDTLGRGVAIMRPTTYFLYNLWKGNWDNDMRNSKYNIKREFYYNNKSSAYFGKKVEPKTTPLDTLQRIYPYPRKVEGRAWQGNTTSGRTGKDFIVYRLAETYLLRAEAYLHKGDKTNAAKDINAVRSRAKAHPVSEGEIDIDYILDERARELILEEPRRRTLCRVGKLVERVKKYNMNEETRKTISDKHNLYPIPQSAIDANFSVKLEQNPGY